MLVTRNGVSVIAAGLDHWFKREDGTPADTNEFDVSEWRLSRQLGTAEFRTPPDYRKPLKGISADNVPNLGISVPFLRFPLAHTCPKCGWIKMATLTERTTPRCKHDGRLMGQAPVVTICENGHIEDFPWREWVHRDASTTCRGDIYLKSTGSATLTGQKVICPACAISRTLANVTFDGVLTNSLEDNQAFLCRGKRPWLGHMDSEPCSRRLVVVLRSATNTYFAQTQSAIFIPRGGNKVPKELVEILESPLVSQFVRVFGDDPDLPKRLKGAKNREIAELLSNFTEDQVQSGIRLIRNEEKPENRVPRTPIDFRREEYGVLRNARNDPQLRIRVPNMRDYESDIQTLFSRITLVEKLRETRALFGFTRVVPESAEPVATLRARLRRPGSRENWLPASVVFGEGIFLELDEQAVNTWLELNSETLDLRVDPLAKRTDAHNRQWAIERETVSARLLLVHTLAHVLINQLVFECGYSASSLRERLYVSNDPNEPMAALLIYTASGDTEGTMGGLVRMGKSGLLESVIRKAIENAAWCSADPVCMEMGHDGGQGPGGLNLAACHACALVPETSCEAFNQGLDRAVLIGDVGSTGKLGGFFSRLMTNRQT